MTGPEDLTLETDARGGRPMGGGTDVMPTWETFLRAHAAVLPLLEADLAREGLLSLSRYDVLANLAKAGGVLRLKELVAQVVLSQPSVTRLVDALEADGLVSRERDDTDRRGTLVRMTADGERALARARSVHARGVREYFTRHLDDAESETVRLALSRVLAEAVARRSAAVPGAGNPRSGPARDPAAPARGTG